MSIKTKKVKLWQLVYTLYDDATLEEGSLDFLKVYNNVRENKDVFLGMILKKDSKLIFIIDKDHIDVVKDWMETSISAWAYKSATEVEKILIQDQDNYLDEIILVDENVNLSDF